jgi:predicted metal-binding protein
MIEDLWKKMSEDPAAAGYLFKKIDPPLPTLGSLEKCRELCAQNLCGEYGVTWGCPPGVGTETECLRKVYDYSKAAVLIKRHEDIDLENDALVKALASDNQYVCRRFTNMLREEGYKVLPLSDGGCDYCGECSYPDDPCRFPDQLVPSISSYGILMEEYMRSQNIEFEFAEGTMSLYGLILYKEP